MTLKKFARALLVLAIGLLACWAARADSAIVAVYCLSEQGFDNGLPAMYSEHLATADSVSTALGALTVTSESFAEAAMPFSFSGTWATSFSNLNLPAAVYWQSGSDPALWTDSPDWVAALPPDFEIARGGWLTPFNNWNRPVESYWDLLSEPLSPPDFRNWGPSLAPAFEMARVFY